MTKDSVSGGAKGLRSRSCLTADTTDPRMRPANCKRDTMAVYVTIYVAGHGQYEGSQSPC